MTTYSRDTFTSEELAYLAVTYALARSRHRHADRSDPFTKEEDDMVKTAIKLTLLIGQPGIDRVAPVRQFLISIPD